MTQTRWTDKHQETAERMRAAGSSYREIAETLGFAQSSIQRKLKPDGDIKNQQRNRDWYRSNKQEGRLSVVNPLFKERNPNYDPRRMRGLWRARGTTI